jgi:hypothetical protein
MSDTDDPLIAGGISLLVAGQLQEGRAAAAEGESAQNIQNYNAAVAESEAKAIEEKGKFEGIRQVREAARIQSALRARLGVSGVRTDIGAPVLLAEEQAAESELAGFLIGAEARAKAGRARSEATLAKLQGKLFRERGRQARTAAFMKAGGTLLTGFGLAGGAAPAGGLPKVGTVTPEAGASFARF